MVNILPILLVTLFFFAWQLGREKNLEKRQLEEDKKFVDTLEDLFLVFATKVGVVSVIDATDLGILWFRIAEWTKKEHSVELPLEFLSSSVVKLAADRVFKFRFEGHKVVMERSKAELEPDTLDVIRRWSNIAVTEDRLRTLSYLLGIGVGLMVFVNLIEFLGKIPG